ncbi:MAG: MASE4 domain-containing protein [Pseudomonadota bacterium]
MFASVLIFIAAAPFARTALPQVPAFIPVYQSALVTNDLITAVLLLGQYSFLRSRALLLLASAYLFSACMAIAHALSFPGLFAPGGAMGAGSQTTAWLYFLWHGGFPLFILAYIQLNKRQPALSHGKISGASAVRVSMFGATVAVMALAVALVLLTTLGHDALPVIMRGNQDDSGKLLVALCTWGVSLAALVHLWRQKPRSVLDLWLMVSMVSWLFDIALSAVLNGARFDLGFYVGRVYGLMASSFVLIVLLLENGRLYANLTDANERERQRSSELEQARNDADAAAQAKSDFLATMSHEIRTPMNGVIGIVDVLARSSLKSHQVAMVDLIRESAFSLLTIIDGILDFSKIEAGRLEIERAPMDVADVVEKVCYMLNRLAEKQRVELTLFTDPAIPQEVLGDALRLRQVLINLANNAIKFSGGERPGGRVVVRALLGKSESEQVFVEFQIIDNGIGMNGDTVAGLFAAFSQADVSTTRRFGGTGLGLAISHNLAELMGGSISVTSTPNTGSAFVLRLPFAVAPMAERAPPVASPVAGLRCLIVGEGETMVCDLKTYLLDAGAQTRQVSDMDAVRELVPMLSDGLWVWIVYTEADAPIALEALRVVARTNSGVDCRFVVIGRGPDRYPQQFEVDRVSLDGNVLTRSALLRAVAVAAGRAQYDGEQNESRLPQPLPVALTREEARRQGRLILVVEDNDINQKVIMQQIALLGLTADLTGDGLQALLRWRSRDYALVVTDLHMPGMDGYQLAAAIRAEESERANVQQRSGQIIDSRMPIIALTANAQKSEAERCKAAGMDDYMSKPIPLVDLEALLGKWLPKTIDNSASATSDVSNDVGSVLAPSAPLDIRVLRSLVGDDPRIIVEFLQAFRVSVTRIAQEVEQAYRDGNAAKTVAAVHKLKSAARSVGAMVLGDLCADMEQVGGAGQLDALAMAFEQFKIEMSAVDSHLAQILPDDVQGGQS